MVTVEIDGVGTVELDDSFSDLSPEEQQKTVNEISVKFKGRRSTDLQKVGAAAKGFNVGALSDVLGYPVDLVNLGLSAVGLGTEAPFAGSESIRRALTAGGMGYMDEQDLPEDQRALARGARTTGQVVGSAIPIFGAASRLSPAQALMQSAPSKSAIKQIGSEMIKSTARNPGKLAAIEGASALGAGQARMIAEDVAPGDELTGTLAEVAGGLLSPVALARKPVEMGKQFANRFSKAGRERAASSKALEILREQNPNITDDQITGVAKQLRDAEGPGRTAQLTEDDAVRKTFTAMDNKLIADAGEEAKNAIKNQNKKTIEAFNRKIRKMQNSGNPEMVKEAARLRLDTFTKQMNKRVDDAESRAGEAVARVLNKNSDDAVGASREARRILDDELEVARKTETKLWGEVDKEVPSPTKKTIEAFNSIKDEISPNEQVMKPLEGFIQGLIKRKDATLEQRAGRGFMATAQRQGFKPVVRVSAKELFRKRSVALNLARQAKATGRFNDARMLNKLADGMLEDLNQVTDASAIDARKFSKSLNERFNTKLIKDIRDAQPEVALETGIGRLNQGSDTQRALNIQAMKRATESTEASEALAQTQKSFIQSSAARIIDPQTGQVNASKLADLIKQNPQTLREVGLLDDVSNIKQQVRLANILQKTAVEGKAFAKQRSIAGQILDEGKKGGLRNVVDNAFNSKYQAEAFRDLNNMVKRAKNPQAVEGLQHEIFDALLNKATIKGGDLDGLISGKQLEDLLNSKIGKKTLRQNLLSSQLITPNQMTQVSQIARKARIFEDSVRDPAKLNDIMKTGDGLLNLFARVVGSKVGANSFLGKMLGGTTLIAQSAFSKMAQKTIEKVPALKVQGVLTKAMQDPKLMAMLLEKSPKSPIQTQRRINAYLLQGGLIED
jgi:hypothetical protein